MTPRKTALGNWWETDRSGQSRALRGVTSTRDVTDTLLRPLRRLASAGGGGAAMDGYRVPLAPRGRVGCKMAVAAEGRGQSGIGEFSRLTLSRETIDGARAGKGERG